MIIPQLGTRSLDNGMPMLTFILLGLGAICSSTQSIDLAIRGSPSMLRATKATWAMSLLTALLGLLRMVTQVVMPMIGSKLYLRPPLDSKLRGFGSFIARNSSTGGMATTAVLPMQKTQAETSGQGHFDCIIGTCNVLTLRATSKHDDADLGLHGPTRQQIVFQQFLDARVCVFALQETRLRQCHKHLCGYLLFRGDASAQGHHGIIIAVSTTIPYMGTM